MKERPILFSAPMVRAILADAKTQTRRAVNPQPSGADLQCALDGKWLHKQFGALRPPRIADLPMNSPYGQPGDRLWVKETWSVPREYDSMKPSDMNPGYRDLIQYHADGDPSGKLRPSIFMPRWASRITLEVVGVRVERLNDCSEADAQAEGVAIENQCMTGYCAGGSLPSAVHAYRTLWESINGAGTWERNPWVWVVEFRRAGAEKRN